MYLCIPISSGYILCSAMRTLLKAFLEMNGEDEFFLFGCYSSKYRKLLFNKTTGKMSNFAALLKVGDVKAALLCMNLFAVCPACSELPSSSWRIWI